MHAYEQWFLRRTLANALFGRGHSNAPAAREPFHAWLLGHARRFGLPAYELWPEEERESRWACWRRELMRKASAAAPAPSAFENRLRRLTAACRLSGAQHRTLGLIARLSLMDAMTEMFLSRADSFLPEFGGRIAFDCDAVRRCLDRGVGRNEILDSGLLSRIGFIKVSECNNVELSPLLRGLLRARELDGERLRRRLFGRGRKSRLTLADFAHLGPLRDVAVRLLTAPERKGMVGPINILLHGEPGVGKTEFACVLAAAANLAVRFVGETDDDGDEPDRHNRVAALVLLNALGGLGRGMLMVVDEADDLFCGVDTNEAQRRGSKAYMNRLVETMAAPAVWITNDIGQLGPAIVRRMTLVIEMRRPGIAVRRAIVSNLARRARLTLALREVETLARAPAPPALIQTALDVAARLGAGGREAALVLKANLDGLGIEHSEPEPTPITFDPTLSNADIDLMRLTDRVVAAGQRALSFCFSGPPGTGKSAFARYLAERLGREVLEKRYADLASMFVGGTEKAIARAFEEAADLKAFLILDEADLLLRDRSLAQHSWEVTEVNEMLTRMERHPEPFAVTTNAPDTLDHATLRRFLFKVNFMPLTPPQIARAYRRAFGFVAPDDVLRLDSLTPADIALVQRKAALLGLDDPQSIAELLQVEASAKPGVRRRIGF